MLRTIKLLASLPNLLVIDSVLYLCTMAGDQIHEAKRVDTTMYCFDCDKVLPDESCPDHEWGSLTFIVQKKVAVPLIEAPRFRRVSHFDQQGVAFETPQVDYLEVAYLLQPGEDGIGRNATKFDGRFVVIVSDDPERLGETKALLELSDYQIKAEDWDSRNLRTGCYVPFEFVQAILKSWQAHGDDEKNFNAGIAIEWLNPPLAAAVDSRQQRLGF